MHGDAKSNPRSFSRILASERAISGNFQPQDGNIRPKEGIYLNSRPKKKFHWRFVKIQVINLNLHAGSERQYFNLFIIISYGALGVKCKVHFYMCIECVNCMFFDKLENT